MQLNTVILGVVRQSIIYAEDRPEKSFTKLRCRMIETYSLSQVKGPVFLLERKQQAFQESGSN